MLKLYRSIFLVTICLLAIKVYANDYFDKGQEALLAGNYDNAIFNFEVGANKGSGSCCAKLALIYLMGNQQDLNKARFWAKKGIELNSARCYGIMGLSYLFEADMETGKGSDKGLPYFTKAYELKDTDTDVEFYGNCALNAASICLIAGDIENGRQWLERVVNDFIQFPSLLGQASYFYLAINDYNNAVKYATIADKEENIYSSYVLGYCLAYGKGIIQNHQLAFRYMEKAALAGLPDGSAEFMLGLFYEDGIGVTSDIEKAEHWYKESAKKNNPSAVAKIKV